MPHEEQTRKGLKNLASFSPHAVETFRPRASENYDGQQNCLRNINELPYHKRGIKMNDVRNIAEIFINVYFIHIHDSSGFLNLNQNVCLSKRYNLLIHLYRYKDVY